MDTDYSNTCDRLDVLVLHILDVMQQILNERQFLDEAMKTGFVNFAKSRYIMGSKSVSTLQIKDSNVLPLKKVIKETQTIKDIEFKSFQVIGCESSKKIEETANELRHRTKPSTIEHLSEKVNNIELKDKSKGIVNDPLKWFGVLVPQSLRLSQSCFTDSISRVARIATLQNELNAACGEYQSMMEKKSMSSK